MPRGKIAAYSMAVINHWGCTQCDYERSALGVLQCVANEVHRNPSKSARLCMVNPVFLMFDIADDYDFACVVSVETLSCFQNAENLFTKYS
jgi:hypothetical protein